MCPVAIFQKVVKTISERSLNLFQEDEMERTFIITLVAISLSSFGDCLRHPKQYPYTFYNRPYPFPGPVFVPSPYGASYPGYGGHHHYHHGYRRHHRIGRQVPGKYDFILGNHCSN
jgi:hypothetical protein